MTRVYLGLGSNLGNREDHIAAAVEGLKEFENTTILKVSTNYNTKALDADEETPDFLNAALEMETQLSPEDLLEETQALEIKLGRTEKKSNAPRTIDIDILIYGEEVVLDDNLTIPHPLMHERDFVLTPLSEIAPTILHPVIGVTAEEMLSDLWT